MALPECATPTVTALVGETATLRCPATGNPDPRRTWTIDGVDVSSPESPVSGRVTLRDDSELLIISSVMAEDSGVYNCFLFNIIAGLPSPNFNDSSDVILEVQSKSVRERVSTLNLLRQSFSELPLIQGLDGTTTLLSQTIYYRQWGDFSLLFVLDLLYPSLPSSSHDLSPLPVLIRSAILHLPACVTH